MSNSMESAIFSLFDYIFTRSSFRCVASFGGHFTVIPSHDDVDVLPRIAPMEGNIPMDGGHFGALLPLCESPRFTAIPKNYA